MVKTRGNRLIRFSDHNAWNSSEWFFFITMALRKGDMAIIVTIPHKRLAIHVDGMELLVDEGMTDLRNGSNIVIEMAITAMERMEYIMVLITIALSSLCQFPLSESECCGSRPDMSVMER